MEVPIDLRYTCATLRLKKDFHPKVIQEHLGHAHRLHNLRNLV